MSTDEGGRTASHLVRVALQELEDVRCTALCARRLAVGRLDDLSHGADGAVVVVGEVDERECEGDRPSRPGAPAPAGRRAVKRRRSARRPSAGPPCPASRVTPLVPLASLSPQRVCPTSCGRRAGIWPRAMPPHAATASAPAHIHPPKPTASRRSALGTRTCSQATSKSEQAQSTSIPRRSPPHCPRRSRG
jgi:hypothetical protein